MKLNDIMMQTRETQRDFFQRTYWANTEWPNNEGKVFVYKEKGDIHNPNAKPQKVMSYAKARRYLEELEPEPEIICVQSFKLKEECKHNCEMIKVSEDTILKPLSLEKTSFICNQCGAIMLSYGSGDGGK